MRECGEGGVGRGRDTGGHSTLSPHPLPPAQAHLVLGRGLPVPLHLALALSSPQPEGVSCEIQHNLGNNTPCRAKQNAFFISFISPDSSSHNQAGKLFLKCIHVETYMCLQEISKPPCKSFSVWSGQGQL